MSILQLDLSVIQSDEHSSHKRNAEECNSAPLSMRNMNEDCKDQEGNPQPAKHRRDESKKFLDSSGRSHDVGLNGGLVHTSPPPPPTQDQLIEQIMWQSLSAASTEATKLLMKLKKDNQNSLTLKEVTTFTDVFLLPALKIVSTFAGKRGIPGRTPLKLTPYRRDGGIQQQQKRIENDDLTDLTGEDRGDTLQQEQSQEAICINMNAVIPLSKREEAIRANLSQEMISTLSLPDITLLASSLFPFEKHVQESLVDCCQGGSTGIAGKTEFHYVTWMNLQCLADGNWINDTVINFEAARLYSSALTSGIFVTTTLFYKQLAESIPKGSPIGTLVGYCYDNVKNVTEKAKFGINDPNSVGVVIPLHLVPNHWAVVMINLKDRTIHFYDSKYALDVNITVLDISKLEVNIGVFGPILENIALWLIDEFGKWNVTPEITKWTAVLHGKLEIPQQNNDNDCGVFCISMLNMLATGKGPGFDIRSFENINVALTRRQIALRIINSNKK